MIRNKMNKILAASAIVCAASVATQANAAEIDNVIDSVSIEGRAVSTTGTVINAPEGLNLRQGPSTSTPILRLLPNGTTFSILSTSNGWHKIEYNGIYGYVSATYVKTSTTGSSSNSDIAMSATGKVHTGEGIGLNLRQNPSTSSSIVTVMPENATVTIVAKNGSWYKVNYNGKTGYAHGDYITLNSSSNNNNSSSNSGTSSNNGDVAMSATGKVYTGEGVGLNLRQSPSTSSSIVTVMPENATVTIVAKNGSWYKVNYNGKTGYAHGDYITLNSSSNNNNSSSNSGTSSNNGDVAMSATGKVYTGEGVGLNLRQSPSTSSSIVTVMPENATVTITAKNGAWYKVNYNGKTGYAHGDYITLNSNSNNNSSNSGTSSNNGDVAFSSAGYVGDTDNQGLNLRKSPSTSASVITVIPQGATVTITAKNGTWYKVNYNGNTGYVAASYIVLGEKPTNTPSADVQGTYEKVLAAMKAQIGSPYVWGGSGEYITYDSIATLKKRFPNEAAQGWYDAIDSRFYNAGYRAFDCSGLMQWGFAQAGVSISRTTYTQVNDGIGVSKSEAQPGDLLITNSQGHVGMYIGNNQWIESPTVGGYVRISTVNWNHIGYVRRVL